MKNVHKKYALANREVKKSNPFCINCGIVVFMADAGEFWTCGKCDDRIRK
jgi:ribosomal protein S27AE